MNVGIVMSISIGLLDDNRGSPERLNNVGIDGPNISVSSIPVR